MWIKKFLIVNINNFKKVDKPRKWGGVGQCGKGFMLNLGTFVCFFGSFITYLAITMRKTVKG